MMKKYACLLAIAVMASVMVVSNCGNSLVANHDGDWNSGRIALVERTDDGYNIAGTLYHNDVATVNRPTWVAGMHDDFALNLNDGGVRTHIRFDPATIRTFRSITLSTWIFFRGGTSPGVVIFGISGFETGHYKLSINDEGVVGLNFVGGLYNEDVSCLSLRQFPQNQWAMATATLNGQYLILYINGEEVAKQRQTITLRDINPTLFRLGSSFWNNIPRLDANLQMTSMWRRALTPEEILAMYNETKP